MLHERLALKANVSYEENGTGPDFRLYSDGRHVGAVEVMSLFMEQGWSEVQARHARIADELNTRLALDRWFIYFDVVQLDRDPSAKALTEWASEIMEQLPDPAKSGIREHHRTYTAQGVRLSFTFAACKPDPAGPRGRIVGPGPFIGRLRQVG